MIVARIAIALLGLLLALPALALDFPVLSGRVVDEADILSAATRATLTQKLADFETKTTDQLVVVTLKSLQGTSIEDFGYQLGRHWQIGQKDKNNGVLLIVAPGEHKVRVEVGYGLEGTLTDAVSRLIIENGILPRFRANDFPGGIARGVDDIISVLSGDAVEWQQRAARRPDPESSWGPLLILILVFVSFGLVFVMVVGAMPSARRKRRWSDDFTWSPGSGAEWLPTSAGSLGYSGSSGGGFSDGGGGFSGGGGSFGGGGASGSW